MFRVWLKRGALLCASLLVAVALSEVLLRVTGLAATDQGVFSVSQGDFERVPGIWEPDQRQVVRDKPALPHLVTTNSHGYRGPDFDLEKPEGELRVLYVGDSFAFGAYVDDDDTMPEQVQRYLRDACGDVRVVNAGIQGSTITEQRPMIERGLVTDPDIVVLQFSENDVTDMAGVPLWDRLAENRIAKSSFPLGLVYPVVRNTAIWGLLLQLRGELALRRTTSRLNEGGTQRPPIDRPGGTLELELRGEYTERFAELEQYVRERDLPLLFVVFPLEQTLHGERTTEQIEWVTGVAEANGVPTVNLYPTLMDGGEIPPMYLMPHDAHPSALGYRIAARPVADAIQTLAGCGN